MAHQSSLICSGRYARVITALLITGLLLANKPAEPVIAGTIIVDNLTDDDDGSCSDGDCSLREAIDSAGAGDTINFGVTGTITLGGTRLYIDKNMTITGPGADLLSIDGDGASRIFEIYGSYNVSISGLTLTNGLDDGGGISNSEATLTLSNCVISGNSGSYGGGIHNDRGGAVTIIEIQRLR